MSSNFMHCLLLVVILTSLVDANDSPVKLDVTVSGISSQTVNVSCSLDPSLTLMKTVDDLKIFGAKPKSKKNDFQTLASVNRWDPSPHLFSSLGIDTVNIDGFFGFESNKSDLSLSWTSPSIPSDQRFKCSVHGTDKTGQSVTISELVTHNTKHICHASNIDSFLHKVDNYAVSFNGVSTALKHVDNRIEDLRDEFNTSFQDVNDSSKSLTEKLIRKINGKIDEAETNAAAQFKDFLGGFQDMMQSLQKTLEDQTLQMKRLEARIEFHISDEFRGKHYLISKSAKTFNIQDDDATCESFGGYLVEIDDQSEFDFVYNFLRSIGTNDHFVTGANDIDQEGNEVYLRGVLVINWTSVEVRAEHARAGWSE
ncbi:hypothetical protein RRG08_047502 [Elysia crispata]|uniref:Uncharacterized protein n=1 Tax=Elysia crispata TaxID=231223 RepID=A0AAE1CNZ4_9GAST|nr:hypothetical protein RRG08_047502 [Elysia crispata]